MVHLKRLSVILLLIALAPQSGWARPYAWPLKSFAGNSSMFGDFRPGRYHAGFDLRTGGEEGWPVVAVGDGYVMRASTSYFGYGRALYQKSKYPEAIKQFEKAIAIDPLQGRCGPSPSIFGA